MGNIGIELTNRCNLSCQHCFVGRYGGRDDLPFDILVKVLDQARPLGFDHVTFTGDDPTVYPCFEQALRAAGDAGYEINFITNGWNFTTIYPMLLPLRDRLGGLPSAWTALASRPTTVCDD